MAKEFNLDYYSIAQLLKFPVVLGIDSQERLKGTEVPRLAYISGLKSLSFPLPVFPFIRAGKMPTHILDITLISDLNFQYPQGNSNPRRIRERDVS